MRVLILGAGRMGLSVGRRMRQAGHSVIGVRRTDPQIPPVIPLILGDFGDAKTYKSIVGDYDSVLVCANPGIRRGKDNGVARGAKMVAQRFPHARVVYTGTCAVYADMQGGDANEDSPLSTEPEAEALLAIEDQIHSIANSLTLRIAAITGPRYGDARARVLKAAELGGQIVIRGKPSRPFSFIHERDLLDVICDAVAGGFGAGVLNVASPVRMTYADFYRITAERLKQPHLIVGDGHPAPSRRIDANRLWSAYPGRSWKTPFEEESAPTGGATKMIRRNAATSSDTFLQAPNLTGAYVRPGTPKPPQG